MEANQILSIVIPTYNRADFLDYCLEVHIPLAREHNIQIFVSDNASTDTTQEVMQKWMKEYSLLKYHRNECNIGPDKNFEIGLGLPDTEYIWLLGDTYKIPSRGIQYLLELISHRDCQYDAFIFNLENKLTCKQKNYNIHNALLFDLGALMTCLSCLVYSRKLIQNANFSKYYDTYFMQEGIIFEDIAKRYFLIHWTQEYSIEGLNHPYLRKNNWSNTSKALEIGCEKWTNFIFSLPSIYTMESKKKCIMDFGKVSGLFSFKNLLILRMKNILNITTFFKYQSLFALTIDYPKFFILLLSIIPKSAIKLLYILFKQYKVYYRKKRNN